MCENVAVAADPIAVPSTDHAYVSIPWSSRDPDPSNTQLRPVHLSVNAATGALSAGTVTAFVVSAVCPAASVTTSATSCVPALPNPCVKLLSEDSAVLSGSRSHE